MNNAAIRNLITLAEHRAICQGSLPFVISLQGEKTGELTFEELHAASLSRISAMRDLVNVQDRVLVGITDPCDFVAAFFAVLYAGAIPVPVASPRMEFLAPLESIAQNCGARLAFMDSGIIEDLRERSSESAILSKIRFLTLSSIERQYGQTVAPYEAYPDSVAFLQYTSGSTSAPKGVMVTHGNLIHNQALIRKGFGHSDRTVFGGWLPLYHDMGLIGNVLQPLYLGVPSILMSPMAFIERPARMLRAISTHHVTTCGMPNFGYAHCVQRVRDDELEGVDLSSWSVAYNGSEPVSGKTMEAFTERFRPYGFQGEAFYPCYGLAEATLFASGWRQGVPWVEKSLDAAALRQHKVVGASDSMLRVVSSGFVDGSQAIRIVAPDTCIACMSGQVGEIWISGPSVARGYWNDEINSREIFGAYLLGGEGPFLRTGDLGFIENGMLYVTGRLKDLIIVRGKNHYPQDIEASIAFCSEAFVPNAAAAFALDEQGDESVIIVQEIKRGGIRNPQERHWRTVIHDTVAKHHQLKVADVKFVLPNSLPRTSSGKIQRRRCRMHYRNNQLRLIEHRGHASNSTHDLSPTLIRS